MEIASPAQNYDGDIDLDFGDDDYNGGVQILEDEHMLTDGEQNRPATATDDMMDDDLQLVETHEADMQDTPEVDQQVLYEPADEELIDYGDEEAAQDYVEDATLVNADDGFNTFQEHTEQADEDIVRQPEEFFPALDTSLASTDLATHKVDDIVNVPNDDYSAAFQENDSVVQQPQAELFTDDNHTALEDEEAGVANTANVYHEDQLAVVEAGHSVAQPALTLDTTTYPDYEQPATPTDTGLHPMTVYYGDHAMPLFKSKRQQEGLLKDDNLASLSLHELLTKCRERLVMKIGNIPEEQEFTLAFDHLGLVLVDNSRAAFEHSLNDVLEIYLRLHSNDGVTDCPPLSLTLSHQQFSGQLALLKQAAQAGSGMSHFVPTSQDAEQYYEENEEDAQNGEAQAEQEVDGAEQQTQQYGEHDQEVYQEGGEAYMAQGFDAQDAQDAQEEYQEQEYAEYVAEEAGEPYEEINEHDAEATLSAPQDHEAVFPEGDTSAQSFAEATQIVQDRGVMQHPSAANSQPAEGVSEAEDAVEHDASLDSSVTLQGDQASGTGEYKDEAEIDWDDDSDLTGNASELPADHVDDFSTLVADLEADRGHEAGQPLPAQKTPHPASDDVADHPHEQDSNANHDQPLNLGSEDLLGEEELDQEANEEIEPLDEAEEAQHEGQQEIYQDQADTYDEQQTDQHDGAGEEAEQSQITDDFANEEAYESGDELQVNGETHLAADNIPNTIDEPTKTDNLDTLELEDTIDFDDDTSAEYAARTASNPDISAPANDANSPLGKRSFDEHNAEDDLEFSDDDEPEMKKVRAG
ncbi:hypothetical protein LTR78_001136 [Recurvomyces mirabilis]|uniref:Uncharacterized protein n=1 Tax=Recurvomyces mirabilis TaxID=574656 RepID=A0AAE0WV10_9PEZI|nr:hypothetical protein LTR78_001136 [Recurvomyces mirabilis]KAK5161112.1 hypothetical protein LTS14_000908 [Recurvomyces mirabilis]